MPPPDSPSTVRPRPSCAVAGKGVEPIEVGVAPHVELRAAALGVGLVVAVFARPDVGHLVGGILGIDGSGEVGKDERGEVTRVGVVFAQGNVLVLADSFTLCLSIVCRSASAVLPDR